MRRILLLAGIGALFLAACHANAAEEKFKLIHTQDLANLMNDKAHKVYTFDANGPETRAKMGMIPGAHPLSSFNKYDVAKELPADKSAKLVFYCANTH